MGSKDGFSDSEDDFEMDEIAGSKDAISPETLELISTLKRSLEENSNQYEQHTQLISLLKVAEMLEELRGARESMSKSFPLSEELWMEWIEDESNMATSEDEKKHVLELYERATSDYLCKRKEYTTIKIWKSHLDYAIQEYRESMEFPENEVVVSEEYLKSLFLKAEKFTGFHISQSHVVWNVWMDFELGKLASQDIAPAEDIKRVKTMYLERIAIPHSDLESTFSSLSSFISKYCGQDYEESMVQSNKIASATREKLAKLESFEEQLETYLRPEDEVNDILAKALGDLASVLNPQELSKVLLANCSYQFRRASQDEGGHKEIRAAFEHALAIVEAAGGDPYCKLERLWIELESNALGDHEQARKLWKSIESKQMSMSDFWIARADMEKKLDNTKGARQIFVRACSTAETLDWPEKIFDSWLLFERERGTLSTYKDALIRTRAALKIVEAVRAQSVQQAYASQVAYDGIQPFESATAVAADNAPKAGSKKRKLSTQDENNVSKISKTKDDHAISTENQKQTKAKPLNISAGHHDDTCFVTNFPRDMTEKKLKDLFKEASRHGTILRCTIPSSKGEGKRLFAYVQFSSNEEAHAALALHGRDVGDRRGLSVQISDTTQKKARGTGVPPLPLVSRHEVHIAGLSNEIKKEDLQKLIELIAEPTEVYIKRGSAVKGEPWSNIKFKSENDADAVLSLNGTMFQSKELVVTRRVFSKSESNQNNSEAPLSRQERRKLAAKARALAEQGSTGQVEGESVAVSTSSADSSTQSQRDEAETKDKEDISTSAPPTSGDAKKPSAPPLLMQPRSMQPRNLQPRGGLKARQSHAFPPKRAFKPASTSTLVTSTLTTQTGEDGAQGSSGGSLGDEGASTSSTAVAPTPAAPKRHVVVLVSVMDGIEHNIPGIIKTRRGLYFVVLFIDIAEASGVAVSY
ncbi:Splicing factor [Mortierella sp. AD094]|nr:Splicing factor [Mortierella sp. AD094]